MLTFANGSGRYERQKPMFCAGPQALLWIAAAGSVAFWVWRMQRRAIPASGPRLAPAAERSSLGPEPRRGLPARAGLSEPAAARVVSGQTMATAALPERSMPWVYRARLALRLGGPVELRRLAVEMAHAGLEAEAGLLENYALLLERSNTSRPRVLAEVARMLEAASVHRQATPGTRRRPLVPMPIVPIEAQRRATG
jgi:hypothetical protein